MTKLQKLLIYTGTFRTSFNSLYEASSVLSRLFPIKYVESFKHIGGIFFGVNRKLRCRFDVLVLCMGMFLAESMAMVGPQLMKHGQPAQAVSQKLHGKNATLLPDQALQPYNAFLDKIVTLKARLRQVNPNGTQVNGMLYVKKPGQLRLNYENGIQLLTQGNRLLHHDSRHNSTDQVDVRDTPLEFFLKYGKLQEVALVSQVFLGPDYTRIVVRSKHPGQAGHIELLFATRNKQPTSLSQWTLSDENGRKTLVFLSDVSINGTLPLDVFAVRKK